MTYKEIIRKSIIELRNNLNTLQKYNSSLKILNNAIKFIPIKNAKNIAIFFSVNGEVSTDKLIIHLWKLKKNIYLPVLNPNLTNQLLFVKYTSKTKLIINKFKIPEPILNKKMLVSLNKLDIIILPLVAFDLKGNRLGMGKGFYDRTIKHNKLINTFLVGLAHDCQLICSLPSNNLDVPLSAVITPSNIWCWDNRYI